jgi:hypothetical protein
MENGEWRMENGEWRMENGEWSLVNTPDTFQCSNAQIFNFQFSILRFY